MKSKTRDDLHEYQNKAVKFIVDKGRVFLTLEMGLGKTVSTLTAITDLFDSLSISRVLVIAPLRVANSVWAQEARKWSHTKHLKIQICTGSEQRRLMALQHDADVYVINRENVPWLVKRYGAKWPFDMVVVDECFPKGTEILTSSGVLDISHVKIGDVVMTSKGPMPVTRTFKKKTYDLIRLTFSDGKTIECTPEHPFATEKGWLPAIDVSGLCVVRGSVSENKVGTSLLFKILLKASNVVAKTRIRIGDYDGKIDFEFAIQKRLHSLEQRSFLGTGNKRAIIESAQEIWTLPDCAWGKWENKPLRNVNARNFIGRMADAICNTYKTTKGFWVSNLLQSRFWNSRKENSFRDRWQLSHIAEAVGREERHFSSVVRVDRIENIKCKSSRVVYNLETDGINDYFANGVLVHNCSSFKSAASQRFKALKKVLPYTDSVVLLTGTPSPNGLLDLWSQVYLVDYGHALGRTMTSYKQRFFESDYMGYKWSPKAGASEQIHALIRPFSLSMAAEDYLDLPDRIELINGLTLDSKTHAEYISFEKKLFMELEDGKDVEAATAAVLANKLLQFCNGALYTDAHKNWSEIHTLKLDALEEIVAENAGENILVAYNYKSDLERLQKRFPDAVLLDKSQQVIDKWNRGEISMLLAHPQSAGHGLNLQHGGTMIVWFSLVWSLEYYQQFNARLHRQGQEKPVRIVHLIIHGCLDERVISVLRHKDATQSALLRALK